MKIFMALFLLLSQNVVFAKTQKNTSKQTISKLDYSADEKYLGLKDSCATGDMEKCESLFNQCNERNPSACRMAAFAMSLRSDSKGRALGFEGLDKFCQSGDKIACSYAKESRIADKLYKNKYPGWQRAEGLAVEARENQNRQIDLHIQRRQLADLEAQRSRDDANTRAQIQLIQSLSPKQPEIEKSIKCKTNYDSHFNQFDTRCTEK